MLKDQIKSEVNKVLDHFSEKGFEEIPHFLKKPDAQLLPVNSSIILQKIVTEDAHLL